MEYNNPVARRKLSYVWAYCSNNTRRLMPVDAGCRQQVILNLLEISVANAAGFHPDQHFTIANGWGIHRLDSNTTVAQVHGCLHGAGDRFTQR